MKFALTPPILLQEQADKYKFELPMVQNLLLLRLMLICFLIVFGFESKPLLAEGLLQSSSDDSTPTSTNRPSANVDESLTVADALTELLPIDDLPDACELATQGIFPEFLIGTRAYVGNYSVWRNCDESSTFVGFFIARPTDDADTLLVLRRRLSDEDDLTPFQLALSEQFQQQVVWGATVDRREDNVSRISQSGGRDTVVSNSSGPASSSISSLGATATFTPTSTSTPTPVPQTSATSTPLSTATPTVTAAAESATTSSGPLAIVEIETLNVRSGPGIDYSRLGIVSRGETFMITGRDTSCSWVQITAPSGLSAWVSAGPEYIRIDGDCSAVARVQPPATPTPAPASSSPPSSGGSRSPFGSDPDQGCYLIENFLRAKLTFTMTRSTDGLSRTFLVPVHSEQLECFEPGPYTYTIDAPPPWNSINGKLDVAPGDELRWSVGGE